MPDVLRDAPYGAPQDERERVYRGIRTPYYVSDKALKKLHGNIVADIPVHNYAHYFMLKTVSKLYLLVVATAFGLVVATAGCFPFGATAFFAPTTVFSFTGA